jgi:hypothetical protein
MKISFNLLVILFALAVNFQLQAQTKKDVVYLNSGEKKEGKVTGITESVIKFRFEGEEFDYELNKSDVNKIEFASGRVETFGESSLGQPAPPARNPTPSGGADTHNKVAVLPFEFISNDPSMSPESMSKLVQSTTANLVRDEYRTLTLQDPLTTNALLAKKNINQSNLSSFTPDELAQTLGVEFVVFGTLSVTNKGTSTFGSGGTVYNEKENNSYNNNKSSSNTKGSVYSSSSSQTTIEYDTTVDFRMFNDRGENLYSQSRHVFGTNMDSYKDGISYMVKRTPFGSKYGKN